MSNKAEIGAVIIGRNEGDRLKVCLEAMLSQLSTLVYVDSGSTDGSAELAKSKGVNVVDLDMSQPFSAARARNSGFKALIKKQKNIKYVQFIDGDCELDRAWLEKAWRFLEENPAYAVVCGRRKERWPERSIYNRLCDIEWDTPIGEAAYCGGDALMRVAAVQQVNGYRDALIAGEEPELCVRLRQQGWKVYRLDAAMTLHDAAMTQFRQWWQRNVRAGHAYAEVSGLHGGSPEKFWVRDCASIAIWGLAIPLFIVTTGLFWPVFFWFLLIYPLQVLRIAGRSPSSVTKPLPWAFFIVLGKFPNAVGMLRYWLGRLLKTSGKLIEYK